MMREARGTRGRNLITAQDAEQYCGFQEKLWMYMAPLMLITRQVTQPCASNNEMSCLQPLACFLLLSPHMSRLRVMMLSRCARYDMGRNTLPWCRWTASGYHIMVCHHLQALNKLLRVQQLSSQWSPAISTCKPTLMQ